MQVTILPLQILSRIVAVVLVALPLAGLRMAVDGFEREEIEQMNHQQLIAFVKEAHASGFLTAYLFALLGVLLLVAAVEGVAFVIRLIASPFVVRNPAPALEDDWGPERGSVLDRT
jgi:hypothetical protein